MRNLRKMMVFSCLALLGALQVTAATFKPYKPQQQTNMVRSMYPMATTTPNASFRSTSAMTVSGSVVTPTSTLNENGTVNEEAYGVGRRNVSGPRRVGGAGSVGNEDDEGGSGGSGLNQESQNDNSENGTPLGDAVLPLLFMSLAFCGYLYLRRKRSEA